MNKKYRTITNLLVLLSFCLAIAPKLLYAESPTRELLKEKRSEVVQERKETRDTTKNLIEQAKNMIKEKIKKQLKGQLITISGNTLTVQKDSKNYTVLVNDQTKLKRKFGASSTLSEFTPKDTLVIIGNRTKNSDGTFSSTSIDASYIRNMSIQRRFAVFTGEIINKTTNTLTLKTVNRGTQTVYLSSTTEIKENNKMISLSDIQVGDKVIVRGELWDRANEKIDAKNIMKLNIKKLSPTPLAKITPEKE
jgi:hypothetical protein